MQKKNILSTLTKFVLVVVLALTLVGVLSTTASAANAHVATTHCQGVDKWLIGFGFYHLSNMTVCSDGSHVWQSGRGPECDVYLTPPFTANKTWCGVYNSGGTYLDVGMNFDISSPYGGNYPDSMRARYYANGSSSNPW